MFRIFCEDEAAVPTWSCGEPEPGRILGAPEMCIFSKLLVVESLGEACLLSQALQGYLMFLHQILSHSTRLRMLLSTPLTDEATETRSS